MGKTQTTKSFSKRIRITKNGKAIRRAMGVNHFKTRKNANGIRRKRGMLTLDMTSKRISAFK
jgi:ribosomal protein L35